MKEMTCSKCGHPVTDDTVFCPECGAAIFRSAAAAPVAPPEPKPVPEEIPAAKPQKKFDFKKLIPAGAVALAAVLALLLSWDTLTNIFGPKEDPVLSTSPTAEATVPSTQDTTPSETYAYDPDAKYTAPSETYAYDPDAKYTRPLETEPPETEPAPTETAPAPTEPDLCWYVENPNYISYTEFFAVERTSVITISPLIWTDSQGVNCVLTGHDGLQVFRDSTYIYRVPNYAGVPEGTILLYADGQYAYLKSNTQITRVDLLTGETVSLFTFDEIVSLTQPFREMCYIAAEMNNTISLCRLYLPTATLDVLYDGIPARTPRGWLTISFPKSNRGMISWEGISPEMVDALYAEFSNPDSKYRDKFYLYFSYDYAKYWDDPELMRQLSYSLEGTEPMMRLQKDKNLQALWKGTYSIADGTVTQDWGVVDTCWFGSGYPHDHWNPELTEDIPPTILNAEAIPVPGMTPPSAQMAESIRQETSGDGNKLYRADGYYSDTKPVQIYRDGEYQTASHLPHVSERNHLINRKYYSYYASVDNTIIRLDLSGSASVIYTAKYGDLLETCYYGGNLYFLDGNTMVMLDTVECTSRELLQHPGSIWMYYDSYDQRIYMDITLGMAINSYLFDPITGAIEETGYRL